MEFRLPQRRKGHSYYEDVSHALTRYTLSAVNQGRIEHSIEALSEFMFSQVNDLQAPNFDTERLVQTAARWVYRTHKPDQFSIVQAARRAQMTPFDLDKPETIGKTAAEQAEILGVCRATVTNHRRWRKEIESDPVKRAYWVRVRDTKARMSAFVARMVKASLASKAKAEWVKEQYRARFEKLTQFRLGDQVRIAVVPVTSLWDIAVSPPPGPNGFEDLLADTALTGA